MLKLNTNPLSYCKITMVVSSQRFQENLFIFCVFRNGILMNLINHAFVLYSSASFKEFYMDVVDGISKLFTVLHFWSFSFFWKCYSFKGRLWYYLSCLMQYQKMSKVSNYKRTLFHNKQEVIGHEEYSMQISMGGINKNDFVFWGN